VLVQKTAAPLLFILPKAINENKLKNVIVNNKMRALKDDFII
jgi:hypothetical protein